MLEALEAEKKRAAEADAEAKRAREELELIKAKLGLTFNSLPASVDSPPALPR